MHNPLMEHRINRRDTVYVNGARQPYRPTIAHRLRVLWNRYNLVVYILLIAAVLIAFLTWDHYRADRQIAHACSWADQEAQRLG